MDELTLEQIKTKSELEEDIDFENGEFTFIMELKWWRGNGLPYKRLPVHSEAGSCEAGCLLYNEYAE
jgi:hypothetical protein